MPPRKQLTDHLPDRGRLDENGIWARGHAVVANPALGRDEPGGGEMGLIVA
jgi:hypothetical protein